MRSGFAAVLAVVLLPGICSSEEKPEIDAPADRAGYSLGYQIGGDLKRQDTEIDAAALLRGLRDGLQGTDPSLAPEEMNAILVGLKQGIEASQRVFSTGCCERARGTAPAPATGSGSNTGAP
jgi:hypothetical protein